MSLDVVRDAVLASGGDAERGAALAKLTSIRVGGPAELLAAPATVEALREVLRIAKAEGLPLSIMGGGFNLLVADEGVPGVTLRPHASLTKDRVEDRGGSLAFTLGGGQPISRLVGLARRHGCVGMEALIGIPGTVGGAVAMNAGTRAGTTGDRCERVCIATAEGLQELSAPEVGFGYRETRLPRGAFVVWARFVLARGDLAAIEASRAAMEADLARRRATQPIDQPTFGSVFRNPPGDHAARLIEACGLKGHGLGGARISERHANFIVNAGGATARDVVGLMRLAKSEALRRFDVSLQPEVRTLGSIEP